MYMYLNKYERKIKENEKKHGASCEVIVAGTYCMQKPALIKGFRNFFKKESEFYLN